MSLTNRFEEALVFATRLHATQVRKGTPIPYISHLLAVSGMALENGATEDEAIAALLHDSMEDQGGIPTLEQIRQRFGEKVAQIVEGCSDTNEIPKPPWRTRKEAYLAHVPQAPASVRLVSLCDKIHNARSTLENYREMGEELWSRFRGGKEGTLWYLRALVEAYRPGGPERLVEELDRVVSELEKVTACP